MEAPSLALRIAQPQIVARDLLRSHHETYPRFWTWSDAAVDQAMLLGVIHTVFGWPMRVGDADIAAMRAAMAEASKFVLAGFELATDVKIVRWPDHYSDPRGVEMWDRVCNLVAAEAPQQQGAA